jgi:hypothetical protein
MPTSERDAFRRDLHVIRKGVDDGVTPKRAKAARTIWDIWSAFCRRLKKDPGLHDVSDPIPFLMVFGERFRDGRLAPNGKPVSARHAEDAVRHVGQAFTSVGAIDPRLDQKGKNDFRWKRTLRRWKKEDGPSIRKKPVPRTVLDAMTSHASRHLLDTLVQALADLIWLGFYFLLRPSEYLKTYEGTDPFTLEDVRFKFQGREYEAATIPTLLLPRITAVGLCFTKQKNGISGETIWLTLAPDSRKCAACSVARRVAHLRHHHAPPTTPLYTYFDNKGIKRNVTDRHLTAHLRFFANTLHLDVDVTVGALRCTGASALMNARKPLYLIQLLGRWRSDEVFRYLHTESTTLMQDVATDMAAGLA